MPSKEPNNYLAMHPKEKETDELPNKEFRRMILKKLSKI